MAGDGTIGSAQAGVGDGILGTVLAGVGTIGMALDGGGTIGMALDGGGIIGMALAGVGMAGIVMAGDGMDIMEETSCTTAELEADPDITILQTQEIVDFQKVELTTLLDLISTDLEQPEQKLTAIVLPLIQETVQEKILLETPETAIILHLETTTTTTTTTTT